MLPTSLRSQLSLPLAGAAVLTLAVLACGPSEPAPEPGAPAPAAKAASPAPETICSSPVRPVGMTAVERFGKWTGGTKSVPAGESPAAQFAPLSAGYGSGLTDTHVYVVTHGWAPGWNQAVIGAGTEIHWWSKAAGIDCSASTGKCEWPSNFAWAPSSTTHDGKEIEVTASGMLPAIVAEDPAALALAYSWLDDSATEGGISGELDCAYHSEGYTNLNGLRMAHGLEQILGDDFWKAENGNHLHLIGHSHGTKVVTTATLALQRGGRKVDHLTILDSPEDFDTREIGAANFNWLYLAEMKISTAPPADEADAVFVDNYVSEFGMTYTSFESLAGVVDVKLDPQKLYGSLPEDWGDDHTYAATWYAGAAPGGHALGTKLALAWQVFDPSSIASLDHLYRQTWPEVTSEEQFALSAETPSTGEGFDLAAMPLSDPQPPNSPVWDPLTRVMTFGTSGETSESFSITFGCDADPVDYEGVAFDVTFESTTADDRLVVMLGDSRYMVLDGGALPSCAEPPCSHLVSFNAGSESSSLGFEAEMASGGGAARITLSDFRCVELTG